MADTRKLDIPYFHAQFPNLDKHHDSSNYTRKEWYEWDEMPGEPAFATGGSVEHESEPEKVKLSDHFK